MTLGEYIRHTENGSEITVWDNILSGCVPEEWLKEFVDVLEV